MNSSSRQYSHTETEWGNSEHRYPYSSPISPMSGQIPPNYGSVDGATTLASPFYHAQAPAYTQLNGMSTYQDYPSANVPRAQASYPGAYPPQSQYVHPHYASPSPQLASSHQQPRRTHSYPHSGSPDPHGPSEQDPVYAQVTPVLHYSSVYPPQPPPTVPAYTQPELETNSYRPYSCEICALSFARQHDLKRHRETHKGEKPFPCNGGCGKAFTRKDALKRHQIVKSCGSMIED